MHSEVGTDVVVWSFGPAWQCHGLSVQSQKYPGHHVCRCCMRQNHCVPRPMGRQLGGFCNAAHPTYPDCNSCTPNLLDLGLHLLRLAPSSGWSGPLKVQKQWVDADQRTYLAAERYPFRQRLRWFKLLLKTFLSEAKIEVAMDQTRPQSEMIQA